MMTFPKGWHAPTDEKPGSGLVEQLYKEVGDGHILKGFKVQLVARRFNSDDAVFALADGRVAEVHMTWKKGGPETSPRFPATTIFHDIEEWLTSALARVES